ncbi:ROK family transcriptional regulator [Microbacterium sp. 2FI]|uniref:ROK family transcriptional regulator n=1 Tax=Microbacterium sp. 2FI TaxID=2502193 RepID=UPI0010F6EF78|nr:ROK family transcriptional regulator [Microbacterium sp. 2FI]
MTERPHPVAPRDQTRVTLLGLIRQRGSATRADLVEATGFSRSTVGNAVARLIEFGLVEEGAFADKGPGSGRGRPGLTLRAVASDVRVAAIDFGARHINVAIGDAFGNEIARERHDVGLDAIEKLDLAASALAALQASTGTSRLERVVAGIPKPVNRLTGLVQAPKVGDGWGGLAPAAEIERRVGVVTHIENDATLGAIGEHARGAARGVDDVLYVKVAHGIGSGLILGGAPYRGANGIVGNIGHCRLPDRTELCRCGHRGCLEAVAAIGAIDAQLAATHPGLDPREVLDELDSTAERILIGAGRVLGKVLADFCNLLAPELVVLGGFIGARYPAFVEGAAWAVDEYAAPAVSTSTRVVAAELGMHAELLGGLVLAADLAAVPVAGA